MLFDKLASPNFMPKTKYRYNPETLSYEEVKLTRRAIVFRTFLVVLPTLVVMSIGVLIGATVFKSPAEIRGDRDAELLRRQLEEVNEQLKFVEQVLADLQHRDDNIYRVIFEADPLPSKFRQRQEETREVDYSQIELSDIMDNVDQRIKRVEELMYAQSVSFDEVQRLVGQKKEMLAAIPSIQPIANKNLTNLTSGFGVRVHPFYKFSQMHTGIDLTAQPGTEIYCTADGVVEESDWMGGYGKVVIVDHGYGYKTLYAHCSDLIVNKGQKVKRGQVIARVGSTGMSTGPHLHYEVRRKTRKDGRVVYEPVDPVNYFFNDLTPEEYQRIIELAAHANQMMS
jgi:murein DD-endopeptidase MepM/ murein hydrolase activator NlpD